MFPDYQFQDAVARRMLINYAFAATDMPEAAQTRICEWIEVYPNNIRSMGRDFARFLFDHFADHDFDTEMVAIGMVDSAASIAEITDARKQRERAAQAPGPKADPDFAGWMEKQLLAGGFPTSPDPLRARDGKYPLPRFIFARLAEEAKARGKPAPERYVSRQEEDALILLLIEEIMEAEPFWKVHLGG